MYEALRTDIHVPTDTRMHATPRGHWDFLPTSCSLQRDVLDVSSWLAMNKQLCMSKEKPVIESSSPRSLPITEPSQPTSNLSYHSVVVLVMVSSASLSLSLSLFYLLETFRVSAPGARVFKKRDFQRGALLHEKVQVSDRS